MNSVRMRGLGLSDLLTAALRLFYHDSGRRSCYAGGRAVVWSLGLPSAVVRMSAARSMISSRDSPAAAYIAKMFFIGRLGRHGVRRSQNVSPAIAGHRANQAFGFAAHVGGGTIRQQPLRIHASHKRQLASEFAFEVHGRHARTIALNGV